MRIATPVRARQARNVTRFSRVSMLAMTKWGGWFRLVKHIRFYKLRQRRSITPLSTLHASLCLRVLVGILAPALILLLCRWLLRGGGLLCLFYETTGLYCPGCGSGRAVLALLRGHPLAALGHNPLLFLLGAPCAALLAREYLRFVFPGLGLKALVLPAWAGKTALGLILAFWLLRNLPGFGFLGP
jgi:hypothetical protein